MTLSYIGESADQDDLNEDFEPWSTCVNTPETFLESNILDEI